MGFAIILVVYIGRNSVGIMTEQVEETIRAEANALSDQYRLGGIRRLIQVVENRSRQPDASLFLVTDASNNIITGNIAFLPSKFFNESDGNSVQMSYRPLRRFNNSNEGNNNVESSEEQEAIIRGFDLESGFRVVVGRDISESKQFLDMLRRTLNLTLVGMILVALAGWFFIGRNVLKRINSVTATSRTIMAGDLSGRLQVTGSGDEFDRLAISLNAMLERIESLMYGLKNVTDNIAHDLKTPLTRLRNRMDAALRDNKDIKSYQETVEGAIDEADHLIRIFNSLLRIARVEAGAHEQDKELIDVANIVHEVYELYEPVAEEEGAKLILEKCQTATIKSNRDLIAQALINLIDNALKYGQAEEGLDHEIRISLSTDSGYVYFAVKDNGPGIAEEDRSKVSKRFARLEESRTMPGSGLGLSLVKAVAEVHEGEMVLTDNCPGLCVFLKLPRFVEAAKSKLRVTAKNELEHA